MLRTFLKKVLPWLVAAAVFAYLFGKYPPANIWNSLKLVDIYAFCGVAISYFILMYLLDSYVISRILRHFGHESSFKEIVPARGLTYLIMIINYAAAQAAFAVYQYRRHGIPISEMLGVFGIIVVMDLYLLSTLACVTTFFTTWPFEVAGMNIGTFVRIFTAAAYLGFFLNLAFWRGAFGKISFLEKLRTKSFFSVLSRAGFKDYLSVAFWRLPVIVFIMIGMCVAVRPFGAHIPFINILANIPLTFFIGSLPLSPGGLGTSNAAFVELMKPFISAPNITAGIVTAGDLLFSFSLVWMFANYIMKAITGVICLKFVSADLFKSAQPTKDDGEKLAIPDVSQIASDL